MISRFKHWRDWRCAAAVDFDRRTACTNRWHYDLHLSPRPLAHVK